MPSAPDPSPLSRHGRPGVRLTAGRAGVGAIRAASRLVSWLASRLISRVAGPVASWAGMMLAAVWSWVGRSLIAVRRRMAHRAGTRPGTRTGTRTGTLDPLTGALPGGRRHGADAAHAADAAALRRWETAGRLIARGVALAWDTVVSPVRDLGERTVLRDSGRDTTPARADRRQHLLRLRRHERPGGVGREPTLRRRVASHGYARAVDPFAAADTAPGADDASRGSGMDGPAHTTDTAHTAEPSEVARVAEVSGVAGPAQVTGNLDVAGGMDANATDDVTGIADVTGTVDPTDEADTTDAADTADTTDVADTTDPADTADTTDPADTADTTDVADTTDPADTADTTDPADTADTTDVAEVIDLAAIEAELADVEIALARLEAGTYWTCEVTGQPLPDELMASEPLRRRLPTA